MSYASTLILMDSAGAPWSPGSGWVEVTGAEQFIGRSSAWARDADNTFLTVPFTGTGITCIGNTPEFVPWNFTSSIDTSAPEYHAMTLDGNDQITYDWFSSFGLSEGNHTLKLTNMTQRVALDYIGIEPSLSQTVRDKTLMVDDANPLIVYTGNWTESSDRYLHVNKRPVLPHGGGAHVLTGQNGVGSILQFGFTGTEIRVYGFYEWKLSGNFTISYTLDNFREEKQYPPDDPANHDSIVQPNFIYYEKTSLSPGPHILTFNVTSITGTRRVIIDAIHYKAAFDTMAAMPDVDLPRIGGNGKGDQQHKVNAGAIAGGVIAGVVGLGLIIAIFYFLNRRKRQLVKEMQGPERDMGTVEPLMVVEPFNLPPTFRAPNTATLGTLEGGRGSKSKFDEIKLEPPPSTTSREFSSLPNPYHSSGMGSDGTHVANLSTTNLSATEVRVEQLERRVMELARETAQLQSEQNPPPYR